jgi:hypothetical protein
MKGQTSLNHEFLGVWERLNNTDFKPLEFEGFKNRAGLNGFVLSARRRPPRTAGATTLLAVTGLSLFIPRILRSHQRRDDEGPAG